MKPAECVHVFVCITQLCSAILAEQWDVSDTQNIIHHSTSDISSVLSKQVRCRNPRRKRLVTGSNLPSVLIYIKPLRFTLEDRSRTNVKCEHTATGLLLKIYRGDMCGHSGEQWPHGCLYMVLSSTRWCFHHHFVLQFCVLLKTAMKIQYTLLLL